MQNRVLLAASFAAVGTPFSQLLDKGRNIANAPCIVPLLLVVVVWVHRSNLSQDLHPLQQTRNSESL